MSIALPVRWLMAHGKAANRSSAAMWRRRAAARCSASPGGISRPRFMPGAATLRIRSHARPDDQASRDRGFPHGRGRGKRGQDMWV